MAADNDILLNKLLEINNRLLSEADSRLVLEEIFQTAARQCNADGCFFYLLSDNRFLSLEYSWIASLNHSKRGSDNLGIYPTRALETTSSVTNRPAAELAAVNQEIINVADVYQAENIDLSLIKKFDENHNYRTVSMLAIPLLGSTRRIFGVAQFFNAADSFGKNIAFTTSARQIIQSLCNLAALVMEKNRLKESYDQLLESFIGVLARAIDAKSPYTGNHCQRVPVIARMLATAAVEEKEGPLASFEMSQDDWYALHIASWLHDCGKVTTPEYIVDKASKLETIYNRIHEIRSRFEILRRDAHIDYLKKRLANLDSPENLQAEFIAKVRRLENDFDFIARCNTGDIPLTDEDLMRLQGLSQIEYMRYFDRTKGLSWAERDNLKNAEAYRRPGKETLLQDLPEHLARHNNDGELYNLSIPSGTINKEEREIINDHIVVTIDMLKALPFPPELSNVVEYAGAHHERVDGKGYPNRLTGEQMSVPAKIMAIADIFEALTASDRPYKEPKKLSEVMKIMQEMKNSGHIDPALYEVFIKSGVYRDYAEQYLNKQQLDQINPEDYL